MERADSPNMSRDKPYRQYIVYCWRYENKLSCKIGRSIFDKFYDSVLKPAMRFSTLDIEILGICMCDSKTERDKLEKHLLNKQFDRVRSDREFVYYNTKVRDWIEHDCFKENWTVKFFQELDNEYKQKHRKRSREYQREKRQEETLKARAQNIYRKWSVESPLTVGGSAVARAMVAEDLTAQGVEESAIQEWLEELENID